MCPTTYTSQLHPSHWNVFFVNFIIVIAEKTLALLYGGQKKGQTQTSGQDMNGQLNGHDMNGQLNGHHAVNGKENGHGINGHMDNGVNGGENGHGMNGHPHSGMNGHQHCGMNGHGTPTDALQQLMNGGRKVTNGHHADVGEDMDIEMTDRPEMVSGQSFLDANCKVVNSYPNGAMQAKGATGMYTK